MKFLHDETYKAGKSLGVIQRIKRCIKKDVVIDPETLKDIVVNLNGLNNVMRKAIINDPTNLRYANAVLNYLIKKFQKPLKTLDEGKSKIEAVIKELEALEGNITDIELSQDIFNFRLISEETKIISNLEKVSSVLDINVDVFTGIIQDTIEELTTGEKAKTYEDRIARIADTSRYCVELSNHFKNESIPEDVDFDAPEQAIPTTEGEITTSHFAFPEWVEDKKLHLKADAYRKVLEEAKEALDSIEGYRVEIVNILLFDDCKVDSIKPYLFTVMDNTTRVTLEVDAIAGSIKSLTEGLSYFIKVLEN